MEYKPTKIEIIDGEFSKRVGRFVHKYPVKMAVTPTRIEFLESPYEFKDEIKAMAGAKWHGYDEKPRKMWSVRRCARNLFRIRRLMGENVFQWWDRPLEDYSSKLFEGLMDVQRHMCNDVLTYHYVVIAAEMALGKTLMAIECIRYVKPERFIWVGPASLLASTRREFKKWDMDTENGIFTSYQGLEKMARLDSFTLDDVPQMMFLDECTNVKSESSNVFDGALKVADLIRDRWGENGYVVPMSGTASPKKPTDIWAPVEIACPGYIKEGSAKQLEKTLAIITQITKSDGVYPKRLGWRDSEDRCETCGMLKDEGPHSVIDSPSDSHVFVPCVNEVAKFSKRISGIVKPYFTNDWLKLPPLDLQTEHIQPSPQLLAAARTIATTATSAMQAMSWMRQLSDGFMYREEDSDELETCSACDHGQISLYDGNGEPCGTEDCCLCGGTAQVPKRMKITKRIPCPKDDLLREDLERAFERGRIVVAAPHTATVERCRDVCLQEGWQVIMLDGRGMKLIDSTGVRTTDKESCLDMWDDSPLPVAWVCNIESGAMGWNLQKANRLVVFSNSFKPHYRTQLLARIRRPGSDSTCVVRDYLHLPADERALEIVKGDRKLELMTLGELASDLERHLV
jgi:hypothetical protein